MFLLCILHHSLDEGTGNCKLLHFYYPWGHCPLFHDDLFDGLISFEMYLDAILTTCLFNTFGDAFSAWDDYLPYSSFVSWCVDGWIAALVVDVVVAIFVCACAVVVGWIVGTSILAVVV